MLICFPCVNFRSSKLSLEKKSIFSSSIPCGKYNKNPDNKLFRKHNRFFFFNGKILVLESNCQLALILIFLS